MNYIVSVTTADFVRFIHGMKTFIFEYNNKKSTETHFANKISRKLLIVKSKWQYIQRKLYLNKQISVKMYNYFYKKNVEKVCASFDIISI